MSTNDLDNLSLPVVFGTLSGVNAGSDSLRTVEYQGYSRTVIPFKNIGSTARSKNTNKMEFIQEFWKNSEIANKERKSGDKTSTC